MDRVHSEKQGCGQHDPVPFDASSSRTVDGSLEECLSAMCNILTTAITGILEPGRNTPREKEGLLESNREYGAS